MDQSLFVIHHERANVLTPQLQDVSGLLGPLKQLSLVNWFRIWEKGTNVPGNLGKVWQYSQMDGLLVPKENYTFFGKMRLFSFQKYIVFYAYHTLAYSKKGFAGTIPWYSVQLWCTHWGQEEPKPVYTLFCCKHVHKSIHLAIIRSFPILSVR